jgi:hypothetical protein
MIAICQRGLKLFAQKAQRPKRSALAFDKASKPSIIIVGRAGCDSLQQKLAEAQ